MPVTVYAAVYEYRTCDVHLPSYTARTASRLESVRLRALIAI